MGEAEDDECPVEVPLVEEFKEAIVQCFAALTEKIEDARSDFVVNSEAVHALVAPLRSNRSFPIGKYRCKPAARPIRRH